jgi:hypothetical protein
MPTSKLALDAYDKGAAHISFLLDSLAHPPPWEVVLPGKELMLILRYIGERHVEEFHTQWTVLSEDDTVKLNMGLHRHVLVILTPAEARSIAAELDQHADRAERRQS